jgi:DUF4097 and DUF4098 domain-containing protein YvlB
MKNSNLFPKTFAIAAVFTVISLAVASYASKKAFEADPDLINRIQTKYNIRVNSWSVTPRGDTRSDQWTLPSPIEKIKIGTVNGEVNIMESEDTFLHVEAHGNMPLDAKSSDRVLDIKTENSEVRITDGKDVGEIKMIIHVPKNITQLEVASVSGDISMKSVTAKEFIFNSISGDLEAENVHFNKVTGVTVSGDVEIDNLEQNEVNFNSVSGDVHLKIPAEQKSKFTLKTLSGDINNARASSQGPSQVIVKTTSGDINIE